MELLTAALASKGEKEIRQAAAAGAKAGLRWKDDEGRVCCTTLLFQAYKVRTCPPPPHTHFSTPSLIASPWPLPGRSLCLALSRSQVKAAQEAEAKERRAASDYERSLSEYCLRTVPLGSDRFHRRYS